MNSTVTITWSRNLSDPGCLDRSERAEANSDQNTPRFKDVMETSGELNWPLTHQNGNSRVDPTSLRFHVVVTVSYLTSLRNVLYYIGEQVRPMNQSRSAILGTVLTIHQATGHPV